MRHHQKLLKQNQSHANKIKSNQLHCTYQNLQDKATEDAINLTICVGYMQAAAIQRVLVDGAFHLFLFSSKDSCCLCSLVKHPIRTDMRQLHLVLT